MQSVVASSPLLDGPSGIGRVSAPSQEPDSSTIDPNRLAQPQLFLGTLTPQSNFDDPSLLASSSWPLLTAAGCSSSAASGLLQAAVPVNNNNNNSSSRKADRNQSNNMPAATSSTSLLDGTVPYGSASSSYYNAAAAAAAYPAYSAMYSATAATPAAAAAYYQQMASSGALRNSSTAAAASLQYALGSTAAAAATAAPYYGASLLSSAAGGNYDYTAAYGANYYGGFKNNYYGLSSAYQSLSSTLDASALSSFTPKGGESKKSKSSKKKKVGGSSSPPEAQYVRVFVWDLDDVSVIAPSQLEMAARLAPAASQPHVLRQAAIQVHSLAFPSSTDHLDINDHEFFQVCNAEDAVVEEPTAAAAAAAATTPTAVSEGEEAGNAVTSTTTTRSVTSEAARRVAAKYAHLRQVYGEYAMNRGGLLDISRPGASKEFEESLATVDAMLGGKTQNVLRCLEIVTARSLQSMDKYANVIISNESVVAQAAQMLLIGAAPYVPLENLFSCGKQGKEMILDRLTARFGKKCSFVVVTSSGDTQNIARKEQMAVWPVSSPDAFLNLYTAQNDFLLGSGR